MPIIPLRCIHTCTESYPQDGLIAAVCYIQVCRGSLSQQEGCRLILPSCGVWVEFHGIWNLHINLQQDASRHIGLMFVLNVY